MKTDRTTEFIPTDTEISASEYFRLLCEALEAVGETELTELTALTDNVDR